MIYTTVAHLSDSHYSCYYLLSRKKKIRTRQQQLEGSFSLFYIIQLVHTQIQHTHNQYNGSQQQRSY